jgi:hypothetical protein
VKTKRAQRNSSLPEDSSEGLVSPIQTGIEHRTTAFKFHDDALRNLAGDNQWPVETLEEEAAALIGNASGHWSYQQDIREELAELRADAARHSAIARGFEPDIVRNQARLNDLAAERREIDKIPLSTLLPFRRWFSKIAKLLLLGDIAYVASILIDGGVPAPLAIAAGMVPGAAQAAVAAVVGRDWMKQQHRNDRGEAPADIDPKYRVMFSDGTPVSGRNRGVPVTFMFATMLISMMAFAAYSFGNNDPVWTSIGLALLAMLVTPASFALEAYGTNHAADLKTENDKTTNEAHKALALNLAKQADAAGSVAKADSFLAATEMRALATELAERVRADRRVHHPEAYGMEKLNGAVPVVEFERLPKPVRLAPMAPAVQLSPAAGGSNNFDSSDASGVDAGSSSVSPIRIARGASS